MKLKGSPRSWCKSFPSRSAAREFVSTILSAHQLQPDNDDDNNTNVHVHATASTMAAVFDGGRTITAPVLEGTSLPRAHLLAALMAVNNSPGDVSLILRSASETVHRAFSVGLPEGLANEDVIAALRSAISTRTAPVLAAPPRENTQEAHAVVAASRSAVVSMGI